eukprot:6187146-Pleurochrysis_carterae.AAC.1
MVSRRTRSCHRLVVDANCVERKRRFLDDSRSDMSSCRWRISATTNLKMLTHLLAVREHAVPV